MRISITFASILLWCFCCDGHMASAQQKVIDRIVFGSCIKQDRPMPIMTAMAEERPDLLLLTGDNIYADTTDMVEMRQKYGQLKENLKFKRLRQVCPMLAVWDDHDFGVNDGGSDFPMRAASQQEFLDFCNVAADSPRRKQLGVYHAAAFGPRGKRLQIILLDTRYFRSALRRGKRRVGGPYYPDEDPAKTMLGETQWAWLAMQLKEEAEVRLIVSGIQFVASASGQECWANLPRERTRLLKMIADSHASGVVMLSGDRHWSELSVTREHTEYPLHDLTCSSLNQTHGRGTPTENAYRAISRTYHRENYGLLEIDWSAPEPSLSLAIKDLDGESKITKQLKISELQSP